MKSDSFIARAAVAVFVLTLVGLTFFAYRAAAGDKSTAATSTKTETVAAATTEPKQKQTKGGSQLWSENCARCHNMRSPSAFSDAEWDVVMHHMRIRAQITAEEHKAILEFLKSSN